VARKGRARSRFVPFGYRTGDGAAEQTKGDRRPLVPHEGEQRVLRRIRELRSAGQGARRIARALQTEGISNPRSSGEWTAPNVGTVLRTMERRAEALG
jgi:hypothetical protein